MICFSFMPHSDIFSPVLGQKKAQLSLLEGCTDDYTAIVAKSFKTPPCLLDNTTWFALCHFTYTLCRLFIGCVWLMMVVKLILSFPMVFVKWLMPNRTIDRARCLHTLKSPGLPIMLCPQWELTTQPYFLQ